MIKAVFHTTLRSLQGFIKSLLKILGLGLTCPHYSRFSRRTKALKIPLRKLLTPGERLNVIFDSTGVKVFGEGEWKVRKHGYSKRRTWHKVHIGMCADSGQVVISAMTSNNVSDEEAMIHMMGAFYSSYFVSFAIPSTDMSLAFQLSKLFGKELIDDRGGGFAFT